MAPSRAITRPMGSLKSSMRRCRFQRAQRRLQHTAPSLKPEKWSDSVAQERYEAYKASLPKGRTPYPASLMPRNLPLGEKPGGKAVLKHIPVYAPPSSARANCKDAVSHMHNTQIALLDPTGSRTRLFSRSNPERAREGDILLVRLKDGEPYAGVCMVIRRAGVDTAVLLRNQLTRVGVEMWYKIYSPNVTGIELVKRKEKRARRAKLYYMRNEEHDLGSLEKIVNEYQKQRAALGVGGARKGAGGSAKGKKKR